MPPLSGGRTGPTDGRLNPNPKWPFWVSTPYRALPTSQAAPTTTVHLLSSTGAGS